MRPRSKISAAAKTAAALLQIKRGDDWLIPEPLRTLGTAEQICAHVDWDHYPVPHALGGGDNPQNLRPLPRTVHQEDTARRVVPAIAKAKRIERDHEAFRKKMLAKIGQDGEVIEGGIVQTIPSREMLGNRASGWKKPMRGPKVRRK